jgi:hypothetical protein
MVSFFVFRNGRASSKSLAVIWVDGHCGQSGEVLPVFSVQMLGTSRPHWAVVFESFRRKYTSEIKFFMAHWIRRKDRKICPKKWEISPSGPSFSLPQLRILIMTRSADLGFRFRSDSDEFRVAKKRGIGKGF